MEVIPVPIRKRIIKLYEENIPTKEIAERFGYCKAAVRRVRQHFRERGTLEPQLHLRGRKSQFTPEKREELANLLTERPDATLAELAQALSTNDTNVGRWLEQMKISLKKKRRRHRSRTAPT